MFSLLVGCLNVIVFPFEANCTKYLVILLMVISVVGLCAADDLHTALMYIHRHRHLSNIKPTMGLQSCAQPLFSW